MHIRHDPFDAVFFAGALVALAAVDSFFVAAPAFLSTVRRLDTFAFFFSEFVFKAFLEFASFGGSFFSSSVTGNGDRRGPSATAPEKEPCQANENETT